MPQVDELPPESQFRVPLLAARVGQSAGGRCSVDALPEAGKTVALKKLVTRISRSRNKETTSSGSACNPLFRILQACCTNLLCRIDRAFKGGKARAFHPQLRRLLDRNNQVHGPRRVGPVGIPAYWGPCSPSLCAMVSPPMS
jgi:hypothetical protein